MPLPLDEAIAEALVRLHPWVKALPKEEQPLAALKALLETEGYRRGEKDSVSGALHVLHLTQGILLKGEFDLSVHAHSPWEVGLLTVDVLELIRVNQVAGFPVGDGVLRATAGALQTAFPTAPVVRIHTDCFCVLFVPSSQLTLTEETEGLAHNALQEGMAAFGASEGKLRLPVDFTLGLAQLRVVDPSHWQLLGPLVWAEAERAHVLARAGKLPGVLRRSVDLAGRVAVEPAERAAIRRRE
jgi:GGDEF domain-containing protein